MTSSIARLRIYWIGVALGPGAWAVNTLLEYALAPFWCTRRTLVLAVSAAILALVALCGAALSWRSARMSLSFEWAQPGGGTPRSFLAWVGAGSGVLFALVIANQFMASLMISSCLR